MYKARVRAVSGRTAHFHSSVLLFPCQVKPAKNQREVSATPLPAVLPEYTTHACLITIGLKLFAFGSL